MVSPPDDEDERASSRESEDDHQDPVVSQLHAYVSV